MAGRAAGLGRSLLVAMIAATLGQQDIAPGTKGSSTMAISEPLTTIDPNAVCMDGSPAHFYFKQGSGNGVNTWLIFLQGGFWCWSQESCQQRIQQSHFMASSTGWGKEYALNGIFADDPQASPAFFNANLVFLKYCSGDAWLGDSGPDSTGSSTFGLNFRGRVIVNATFSALRQFRGLQSGARVLFGGCSAGGLGALANIDAISASLDSSGLSSLQFAGFFDASAWVDLQPPPWIPAGTVTPLTQTVQELYGFINPDVPADCLAAYPGSEWMCIWPSGRIPFVQTPFLLNAAQFDSFYFSYELNAGVIQGSSQQQWAVSYQNATLELFNQLPAQASLFSTSCEVHCISLNDTFSQLAVNGVTLADVLTYWFLDDAGGTGRIRNVDTCAGWGCTHTCTGGIWSPSNTQCQPPSAQVQEQYGYVPDGGIDSWCGEPGVVSAGLAQQDADVGNYIAQFQGGGSLDPSGLLVGLQSARTGEEALVAIPPTGAVGEGPLLAAAPSDASSATVAAAGRPGGPNWWPFKAR